MIILDFRFHQNDRTVSIQYLHKGAEGYAKMTLDFMKKTGILDMDNLTEILEDYERLKKQIDSNGKE